MSWLNSIPIELIAKALGRARKSILVLVDLMRDWCEWFFLRQEQIDARAARLSKLLDLKEELEFARAAMHTEEFMLGNSPTRLAARIRALSISGPETTWLDEHMSIYPPCENWVGRLLYACEIKSLRVAGNAWAKAEKKHAWRRKVNAVPD